MERKVSGRRYAEELLRELDATPVPPTVPMLIWDESMLTFEDVLHALGCVDCDCGHYDPPPSFTGG